MAEVEVRLATAADIPSVAAFRWSEDSDRAVDPAFVARFVQWVDAHPWFHCVVALDGDTVVGMSWLVEQPRVPGIARFERAGGDIQTVFVLPEYRNAGIGSRMMQVINKLAQSLELLSVTVHSRTQAIPFYKRAGYADQPKLLEQIFPAGPSPDSWGK